MVPEARPRGARVESERFMMTVPAGVSRRTVLAASAAAAAAPLAMPGAAEASSPQTYHLTVLGTSDTHGNVYNWDYYRDAEYDDSAHNDVGMAKLAALVNRIRAEATG